MTESAGVSVSPAAVVSVPGEPAQVKRKKSPMRMDALERRLLMAVLPVFNSDDSGAGSLRDAVANAQPGELINLTEIDGTITLTSGSITSPRPAPMTRSASRCATPTRSASCTMA